MNYRVNDKVYDEVDLSSLSIDELNDLTYEIQTEIKNLAKQKQKISTLPKNLKDTKSLKKLTNIKAKLIDLQNFQLAITNKKRLLKKSANQQLDWYKCFLKHAEATIRKGKFDKLVQATNEVMNYSI